MRLSCPNCDAQYEVDDAAIPENGRDVQCSNCGHTWFQPGPGAQADTEVTPPQPAPAPEPEPEPEPVAKPAAPPEPEPKAEPEPVSEPAEQEHGQIDLAGALDESEESPADTPKRRDLDDAVLSVLREEAEHEKRARRAEAGGDRLESQPELGLDSAAAAAGGGLQERMARLRGVVTDTASTVHTGSRRDLLPDIEEINSTLRATSDRHGSAPVAEDGVLLQDEELPRGRGGFGLGFGLVVLIAVLIVVLYVLAPNVVSMAPATEPVMNAYVSAVDAVRLALHGWLRSVTDWLIGLAAAPDQGTQ